MYYKNIPEHLLNYIYPQENLNYTNEDQEVWRFIFRQMKTRILPFSHPSHQKGIELLGFTEDHIPQITELDEKLSKYGWRAAPVSGFLPPAIFMDFQAQKILPVATAMRRLENILYTPAPDIVHESAGHAPMLIDSEYSDYLSEYALLARHALYSKEDLKIYEAVRNLSDFKESSHFNPKDLENFEYQLNLANQSVHFLSEASLLARMNWWTAEYGLIEHENKICLYGAGLLSSLEEGGACLSETGPKKLEFGLECIDQKYDITEPQPQLYFTKSFSELKFVLREYSKKMAYKKGGIASLEKAYQGRALSTVVVSSGESYSGVIASYRAEGERLISLRLQGPFQVSKNKELLKQSLSHESTLEVVLAEGAKVLSVYGGVALYKKFREQKKYKLKKVVPSQSRPSQRENDFRTLRDLTQTRDDLKFKEFKESLNKETHWLVMHRTRELCEQYAMSHSFENIPYPEDIRKFLNQ